MFFAKVFLLAFMVFANTVLAVSRVTYSAKYNTGSPMDPQRVPIAEQYADDNKGPAIVENMATWSGGRYNAKVNARTGVVLVQSDQTFPSKNEALAAVNDMMQIVADNYQPPA